MKNKSFTVLLCLATLACSELVAQKRSFRSIRETPMSQLYLGVEGNMGTRSFNLKSDLTEFNNLRAAEEGMNVGLLFGNEKFLVKGKQGFYHSSSTMERKVLLTETEATVNVLPLQILSTRSRYIEPYLLVGLERNIIKLHGFSSSLEQWLDNAQANAAEAAQQGSQNGSSGANADGDQDGSQSGGDGPPDPEDCGGSHSSGGGNDGTSSDPSNPGEDSQDQESTEEDAEDAEGGSTTELSEETSNTYMGSIKTLRTSVGVGVRFHIPSQRFFLNLFSEVKYGFSVKQQATHPVLNNTKVSNQLTINVGISLGIRSF